MTNIAIDAITNRQIEARPFGGLCGQISFRRLVDELRASGEIKADETITHFEIDAGRGMIVYRVEDTKQQDGTERERIEKRIRELTAAIDAAPAWGADVSVRYEERRALQRRLAASS